MKAPLSRIAHTRSGDKGDMVNIGVIAWRAADYRILVREVTARRVFEFFGDRVAGPVERFEAPVVYVVRCACTRIDYAASTYLQQLR